MVEEEVKELCHQSAPVSATEVPVRSPVVGKGVKARGSQSDLRSSLGDSGCLWLSRLCEYFRLSGDCVYRVRSGLLPLGG